MARLRLTHKELFAVLHNAFAECETVRLIVSARGDLEIIGIDKPSVTLAQLRLAAADLEVQELGPAGITVLQRTFAETFGTSNREEAADLEFRFSPGLLEILSTGKGTRVRTRLRAVAGGATILPRLPAFDQGIRYSTSKPHALRHAYNYLFGAMPSSQDPPARLVRDGDFLSVQDPLGDMSFTMTDSVLEGEPDCAVSRFCLDYVTRVAELAGAKGLQVEILNGKLLRFRYELVAGELVYCAAARTDSD